MVEVLSRLQDQGYEASLNTFITSSNLADIVTAISTQEFLGVSFTKLAKKYIF